MGFKHRRHRRLRLAAGLALVAGATSVAPAVAGAAVSATVTGNDGNPVAITPGLVIANMDAKAGLAITPDDKANYSLTIAGPDGIAAASSSCQGANSTYAPSVDFRGNGVYTLTAVPHAANDYSCTGAATGATATFAYTVSAAVGLTGPPTKVLIRAPNSFTTIPVSLPITLPPGGLTANINYASGAVIGPDGAISGPSQTGYVDTTTGTVPLSITKPGTYTVVAREQGFSTASGSFFTPWTAPVKVVAVVPFDLTLLSLTDSRGPSYAFRGQIREPSATGKVAVALARGTTGKYHGIGTVKIHSKGVFTKRFRQSTPGTYRLRITYSGNGTTLAGKVVAKIKIYRRFL